MFQYLMDRAAEARKKSETATNPNEKEFWLNVAKWNEMVAAKIVSDECIDRLKVIAKEGGDGAAGFILAVLLGEEGRAQMLKLGGTTQIPEQKAFEFGLRCRPLIRDWLIGQLFGAAGLPALLKAILGK